MNLYLILFIHVFEFCRYADFIINEGDLNSNFVHLTSLVAQQEVLLLLDISPLIGTENNPKNIFNIALIIPKMVLK